MDQIYVIKIMLEEYLKDEKKSMLPSLHRPKIGVDRKAFWNSMKIYDVGELLLGIIKTFYLTL